MPAVKTGLYIHVPFCEKKCPYCDFNTYAGLDALHDSTVDALCREMTDWASLLRHRPISSVFLGGGTPSALSAQNLERLLNRIHSEYALTSACEITSEVNPGTVDRAKFRVLKTLGVTRLSLGVQSFHDHELQFLGRIHNGSDVLAAYKDARSVGFDNVNLDFIFGLPEQSLESWRGTLRRAINLQPEHLSLYSLIVEPNTPLNHWVQTGRVSAPDEDVAAQHFEAAIEMMSGVGYSHYEVSNWSREPAAECTHNLIYWRNDDFLGFGPGAHSHLRLDDNSAWLDQRLAVPSSATANAQSLEYRWGNRKSVTGYIKRVNTQQPTRDVLEMPPRYVSMGETMMLGLRLLREGVPRHRFINFYGKDFEEVFASEIAQLLSWGLVRLDASGIYLSSKGLMFGNQVFSQFLAV